MRQAACWLLHLLLAGCGAAAAAEPIQPLPVPQVDAAKVDLGRRLFHDARISGDGKTSCASCHAFDKGGADSRRYSPGSGGAVGGTNALSVFNMAWQPVVNWDGRSASVAALYEKLVPHQRVMGGSWEKAVQVAQADPEQADRFRAIYAAAPTKASYLDAATAYVLSLATPSRFDRYLRGDATAITAEEREGYEAFKAAGCTGCHAGIAVGGNVMRKLGIAADYFEDKRRRGLAVTDADRGRFNVSKDPADMHVFKVPSLRNVALSAPYFHDGSAATLDEAVDAMFRYQLGREAAAGERARIVKFLGSLTGETLPRHP